MKNYLLILLGVVIGVGGFYFVPKIFHSKVMKPNSPTYISIMFDSSVNDNKLADVRALMTPQQKHSFTASDLRNLRQYIGAGTKAEGGSSLNNYEVITYGNKKAITLWLVPPMKKNGTWQIQKITNGNVINHLPSQK